MVLKILLFGTSGNPPTGPDGHSGIVEYFVSLRQFDEIWVLPVYKHMFAAKREIMDKNAVVTYDDRIEMCRLAFERHSTNVCKVRVKRTEQEVFTAKMKAAAEETGSTGSSAENVRTSTYDLIQYLRETHPSVEFSFLIGTDTYRDILGGKWRQSKELLETLDLVVVDRLGVRNDTVDLLAGLEIHHPPMLTDISSTKIRDATVEELDSTLALDPPVLEYIRQHRFYGFGRETAKSVPSIQRQWLVVLGAVALGLAVGAAISGNRRRRGQRG